MSEVQKKLGALLKLERERRQISVGDISAQLNITEEYIASIESGDPSGLPSELYFNMFARSYCEAVGIDFARTVEAIKEEIGQPLNGPDTPQDEPKHLDTTEGDESADEVSPATETGGPFFSKKLMWLFAAIVVAFGLFVGISRFFTNVTATNTPEESRSIVIEDKDEPLGLATASEYADYKWTSPPTGAPKPIRLELVASEESWATVLADGDTAIFRRLIPGRTYDVTAKYRFKLSIALPRKVSVTVNGKAVNLANPESGRISRVEITQVNLESILAKNSSSGQKSSKRPITLSTEVQSQTKRDIERLASQNSLESTPASKGGSEQTPALKDSL
ncbi:MAG: helix-turn-helix domain-containing protein [Candidatus Zixiibacteriota bacterium]